MTETRNGAKYIDRNPPLVSDADLDRKVVDYLAYLKEILNFSFATNGKRLTDVNGNVNELSRTAGELVNTIYNAETGLVTQVSQQASEITLMAGKLNNLGGTNLIINTFDTASLPQDASGYIALDSCPRFVGQPHNSLNNYWLCTPVTHGVKMNRTTNASTSILNYTFGSTDPAREYFGMQGLTAGETYTFSADMNWRLLTSATTTQTYVSVRLRWFDSNNNSTRVYAWQHPITPATEQSARAVATFTIPLEAVAIAVQIIVIFEGGTSAPDASAYPVGDWLQMENMKMEVGAVATAWSAAPQDFVGNDQIISKINVSPEAIQIAANKISLAGKTIDLTSDTITIQSTNFSVTPAGIITATGVNLTGTFNMTDGSINISTTSLTNDVIQLAYSDALMRISPSSLNFKIGTKNRTFQISASIPGLRWFDDDGGIAGVGAGQIYSGGKGYGGLDGSFVVFNTAGTQRSNLGINGVTLADSNGVTTAHYYYDGITLFESGSFTNRARLTYGGGLVFKDASNNVTATYPASGLYLGDLTSKNYFNQSQNTISTNYGVTITPNNDGTFTIKGVCTTSFNIVLGTVRLAAGTNYILTGATGGSASTAYLNIPSTANDTGSGSGSFTVSSTTNYNVRILVMAGSTNLNLTFSPMVRRADTSSEFVPRVYQPQNLRPRYLDGSVTYYQQTSGTSSLALKQGVYLLSLGRYNTAESATGGLYLITAYPAGTSYVKTISAASGATVSIASGGILTITTTTNYYECSVIKMD